MNLSAADRNLLLTPIRHAVEMYGGEYSNMGSDYSVTELLQPPRLVHLEHRHSKEIARRNDMWGTLAALDGTAKHDKIESLLRRFRARLPADKPNPYIIEMRLWDRILNRKISGKFDLWYNRILYDIKVCKTWKLIFGDYDKWEEQLNLYAYFCKLSNIPVDIICILAWFRDWNPKLILSDPEYPRYEIEPIPLTLWDTSKQKSFLTDKLHDLIITEEMTDRDLPPCSAEDRWEKETTFAVYAKKGDRRARRVLKTNDDAYQWNKEHLGGSGFIEKRPGAWVRCESYCDVAPFCNQYQKYKEAKDRKAHKEA